MHRRLKPKFRHGDRANFKDEFYDGFDAVVLRYRIGLVVEDHICTEVIEYKVVFDGNGAEWIREEELEKIT